MPSRTQQRRRVNLSAVRRWSLLQVPRVSRSDPAGHLLCETGIVPFFQELYCIWKYERVAERSSSNHDEVAACFFKHLFCFLRRIHVAVNRSLEWLALFYAPDLCSSLLHRLYIHLLLSLRAQWLQRHPASSTMCATSRAFTSSQPVLIFTVTGTSTGRY